MLRIYYIVLALIRRLKKTLEAIGKHDKALERQAREALSSIALNAAEGSGNTGGHKRERYQTALGSAREALGCFETAEAHGYVGPLDEVTRKMFDHVIGTFVNLVKPKR